MIRLPKVIIVFRLIQPPDTTGDSFLCEDILSVELDWFLALHENNR